MILELKVDHKPEEAISQIKEKEYAEITHKRQSLMNVFKTCCSNKEVK